MTARPVEDRDPMPLEEFSETWDAPETEEARKGWRIEHDGQLDWVMRKLRDARRAQVKVQTRAQAEIDRVQAWADRETARCERDVVWFGSLAQEYALKERARDEDRKTLATPYGVVKTREKAGAWDIDEVGFLAWARRHRPDLVKTVESVKLAEAKKYLGPTVRDGVAYDPDSGEAIPWVKVGEPTITATVDVDLGLHADDEAPR